jgi:hypothetical protein
MTGCTFCGKLIDDGAVVCPWCGRRQTQSNRIQTRRSLSRRRIPWGSLASTVAFLAIAVFLYWYFASTEAAGRAIVLPRIAAALYMLLGKWSIIAFPLLFAGLSFLNAVFSLAGKPEP